MKRIQLFFLLVLFVFQCAKVQNYDQYFYNLSGRDIETGKTLYFRNIKTPVLIMNFYSPTCLPCVEELPALHLIYREVKKLDFQMFLAVEPDLERNMPEIPAGYSTKSFDENSFQLLRQVLWKDKKKRNIQIPVVILNPPFRIDPEQIITGTPETVILTTNPIRLHYNFVGPIATGKTPEEIQRKSRFQFFIRLLRSIGKTPRSRVEDTY